MKKRIIVALSVCVLVSMFASPLQAANKIFTGDEDQNWDEHLNWIPFGVPAPGDYVFIPAEKTCIIPPDIEEMPIISGFNVLGKLQLEGTDVLPVSLTIQSAGTDSVLAGDGEVWVSPWSSIIIANHVTITGSRSYIWLAGDGAEIKDAGAGGKLKLEHTCGSAEIQEGCAPQIRGCGTISVELENNGMVYSACVASSNTALKLTDGRKYGRGIWTAKEDTLLVLTSVTGGGTWLLNDTYPGIIRIEACCRSLTGKVDLTKGLFDVRGNFCTTGQLRLASEAGVIEVHPGFTASFDGSCIPCS